MLNKCLAPYRISARFALNSPFMCGNAAHVKGGGDLNANRLKSNIREILQIFQRLWHSLLEICLSLLPLGWCLLEGWEFCEGEQGYFWHRALCAAAVRAAVLNKLGEVRGGLKVNCSAHQGNTVFWVPWKYDVTSVLKCQMFGKGIQNTKGS